MKAYKLTVQFSIIWVLTILPFILFSINGEKESYYLLIPMFVYFFLSTPLLLTLFKNLLNIVSFGRVMKPCDYFTGKYSYFGKSKFLLPNDVEVSVGYEMGDIPRSVEFFTDNFIMNCKGYRVEISKSPGEEFPEYIVKINNTLINIIPEDGVSQILLEKNLDFFSKNPYRPIESKSAFLHVLKEQDFVEMLTKKKIEVVELRYMCIGADYDNLCSVYLSTTLLISVTLSCLPLLIDKSLYYLFVPSVFLVYFLSTLIYNIMNKEYTEEEVKDHHTLSCHEDNTITDLHLSKSDSVWCNLFHNRRIKNPNVTYSLDLGDNRIKCYYNNNNIQVDDKIYEGLNGVVGETTYFFENGIECKLCSKELNNVYDITFSFSRKDKLIKTYVFQNKSKAEAEKILFSIKMLKVSGKTGILSNNLGVSSKFQHSYNLGDYFEDSLAYGANFYKHQDIKKGYSYYIGKDKEENEKEIVYVQGFESRILEKLKKMFYDDFDFLLNHNYLFFKKRLNLNALGYCIFNNALNVKDSKLGNSEFKRYSSDLKTRLGKSFPRSFKNVVLKRNTSEAYNNSDVDLLFEIREESDVKTNVELVSISKTEDKTKIDLIFKDESEDYVNTEPRSLVFGSLQNEEFELKKSPIQEVADYISKINLDKLLKAKSCVNESFNQTKLKIANDELENVSSILNGCLRERDGLKNINYIPGKDDKRRYRNSKHLEELERRIVSLNGSKKCIESKIFSLSENKELREANEVIDNFPHVDFALQKLTKGAVKGVEQFTDLELFKQTVHFFSRKQVKFEIGKRNRLLNRKLQAEKNGNYYHLYNLCCDDNDERFLKNIENVFKSKLSVAHNCRFSKNYTDHHDPKKKGSKEEKKRIEKMMKRMKYAKRADVLKCTGYLKVNQKKLFFNNLLSTFFTKDNIKMFCKRIAESRGKSLNINMNTCKDPNSSFSKKKKRMLNLIYFNCELELYGGYLYKNRKQTPGEFKKN